MEPVDKIFKEVGALVNLVKLIIGSIFAVACWQTYVQLTLNQHSKTLEETKIETNQRNKDWSQWREEMVKITSRQTTLLEVHQADLNTIQLLKSK